MTKQIDELMALANDLLFAPNHLRKKKSQALRAALEAALKPEYDQQALELCDVCGWKAVIPDDGCLNCQREAALKPGSPDKEMLQFLTDVVTAAGLLEHGKQSKALAERISNGAYSLRPRFVAPPAQPDAMVKRAGELLELFNDPSLPEHSGCMSKKPPARLSDEQISDIAISTPPNVHTYGRAIETEVRKKFGAKD